MSAGKVNYLAHVPPVSVLSADGSSGSWMGHGRVADTCILQPLLRNAAHANHEITFYLITADVPYGLWRWLRASILVEVNENLLLRADADQPERLKQRFGGQSPILPSYSHGDGLLRSLFPHEDKAWFHALLSGGFLGFVGSCHLLQLFELVGAEFDLVLAGPFFRAQHLGLGDPSHLPCAIERTS